MQFSDILKRVKGQTVIINNSEERVLFVGAFSMF